MNAETTLTLLTKEGAITVTFRPALGPERYVALYDLILADAETPGNLCQKIREMARHWNVQLDTADC